MATAELVPNFWCTSLTQQYFDDESFFLIVTNHHLLSIGWHWAFVPTQQGNKNEQLYYSKLTMERAFVPTQQGNKNEHLYYSKLTMKPINIIR